MSIIQALRDPAPRPTLPVVALAVALGVTAGMGLRALFDPWLGDGLPFIFAFPAVATVALLAGRWPAVLTAALSVAWAAIPWLPPGPMADTPLQLALAGLGLGATALIVSWRGRPVLAEQIEPLPVSSAAERWLQVAIVMSAVLPTVFFIVMAWRSHSEAMTQAEHRVESLVRLTEEHAQRVIETNEVLTRQLIEMIGNDNDAQLLKREGELHRALRRIAGDLAQIQSIWVWDTQGVALLSSRFYPAPRNFNVADREYFVSLRDERVPLFITGPLISRSTGEPFFDVARRREGPDGSFRGVISVSMLPTYFTEFYRSLNQGEDIVLGLVHADGGIIARWPMPPQANMKLRGDSPLLERMRSGTEDGVLRMHSSTDGRERLVAFHRLQRYPLYVTSGVDLAAIRAVWAQQMAALAAATFPAAISLVFVSWIALRRTRRELAALEQLRREADQRRRVEDALRQAQKLEALGRLTGGVAHDFNNLLTVINNNAHLLAYMKPELAGGAQLSGIQRAVKAGEKLTRQLLAFSRRQALRPEVLRLQDALPLMQDLIQTTVSRQIQLRIAVAEGTPTVEVDRAELELALLNLTINARDAMPDGGRIAITAQPADAERVRSEAPASLRASTRGYALISVTDTGHGIATELLDKVFEPFFTTKELGQGTGLGLSQVYGFCVQAGGYARIDSEVGVGTTVTMILPATDKPVSSEAREAPPLPTTLTARVLLVEDNPEVAKATAPLLESFGGTVTCALSAQAALDALNAAPDGFDIVLSDIVMPGEMNGIGLALEIRKRYAGLPVVLMTGYASEIHRALAAGFDVLPKPCSPQALASAIAGALREPQQTAST